MQGHIGLDAILFAAGEQLVVVLNASARGSASSPLGEDAGPGDGHTNGVESMLGRKADILLVAVVEITGRVGQKATLGDKVIVPHGLTLACHLRGTFRLVRGGCGAPNKALRQLLYAVLAKTYAYTLSSRCSILCVCAQEAPWLAFSGEKAR